MSPLFIAPWTQTELATVNPTDDRKGGMLSPKELWAVKKMKCRNSFEVSGPAKDLISPPFTFSPSEIPFSFLLFSFLLFLARPMSNFQAEAFRKK